MSKTIEFFFDFGSPTTYLANTQLPKLAQQCGAHLVYRPMLLGGVFKATGNASPVTVPAKGRWMGVDIQRWAEHYGVPFAFNPHFPINTLSLMRGACGMQMRHPDALGRYIAAVFQAMWVQPCNMGDPQVLAQVLGAAGFEAQEFMDLIADPQVKAQLISNTDEAVARGVFGAPSMLVGDQLFFGQDRLDFVRQALA